MNFSELFIRRPVLTIVTSILVLLLGIQGFFGMTVREYPEVEESVITVTTVYPGLMRTGSPFNAQFKGRHREEFTWFALADSLPGTTVDAEKAAATLIDACRYGDAEVVIGWPAKLAIVANALAPEIVAHAMANHPTSVTTHTGQSISPRITVEALTGQVLSSSR